VGKGDADRGQKNRSRRRVTFLAEGAPEDRGITQQILARGKIWVVFRKWEKSGRKKYLGSRHTEVSREGAETHPQECNQGRRKKKSHRHQVRLFKKKELIKKGGTSKDAGLRDFRKGSSENVDGKKKNRPWIYRGVLHNDSSDGREISIGKKRQIVVCSPLAAIVLKKGNPIDHETMAEEVLHKKMTVSGVST